MAVFLFFFIIPIGIFLVVLKKVFKDTKADAWEGEVTDKLINQKRDSDHPKKMNTFYTIVFTTKDGKTRKMAVMPDAYETWKIGEKVRKEKGKLAPERIS